MADRKKLLRKRKENEPTTSEVAKNEDEASKLEYEVAKYLRNKLPKKSTTLLRDKVDYFIASKAIDCLLDSKWATNTVASEQNEPLFTTRESVVDYLNTMLEHRFFHRASKIVIKDKKKIKDADDENATDSSLSKKKDKKRDDEEKKEKKKEKKKIKLDIHQEQLVVDSNEPYVWLYEPVSIKSWIFGFLLVIGVVGICLFPLWPSILRDIVYYISLAAASFIIFMIGLAILKCILFFIVWAATFGKHHFWLLPNLTEDVGFFASFVPLYEHKTRDDIVKESDKQSKKKPVKESKKKKKIVEVESNDLKEDQNSLDEQNNRSDGEEVVNNQQQMEEGSEDSSENEKFEIVDDNEIPPILRLDL